MRRLSDYIVGTLLVLPILLVGAAVLMRDLWRMNRVRWTRRRFTKP